MESTSLDFETISKKLEALAESQQQRKKASVELLDKVRPALLKAHEKKVAIGKLAEFLKENGIAVSVPTLRSYFRGLPGVKVRKRLKKKHNKHQNNAPAEMPSTVKEPDEKKLPPRLARQLNHEQKQT
jgi:hypothetical protein